MKSVLADLFLSRKYICIYLFCYFYPAIVAAESYGLLYFKFLCYKNPENKLPDGRLCDINNPTFCRPTFTICIGTKNIQDGIKEANCNIHYQKTRTYDNYDLICNNPHGSKNYLEIEIKKVLSLPLKKTYFVKIDVRDVPWRNNQLIASFGAEFNQIPSTDVSQFVYKAMSMNRTDLRYANPGVSLDISMALYESPKLILPPQITSTMTSTITSTMTSTITSKVNTPLIFGLIFGISVLIIVGIVTGCFITKQRASRKNKLLKIDENPMSLKALERKDYSLPYISNQHSDFPEPGAAYEEIDERNTYEYLLDKNDEYLIPREVPPPNGQLHIHNPDDLKSQSKEVPVENDNIYIPLPTREIKKGINFRKI